MYKIYIHIHKYITYIEYIITYFIVCAGGGGGVRSLEC